MRQELKRSERGAGQPGEVMWNLDDLQTALQPTVRLRPVPHDDPARIRWASKIGQWPNGANDKGHAKPAGERSGPGNRFAMTSPIRGADTSSNQPIIAHRGAIQARAAVATMTV